MASASSESGTPDECLVVAQWGWPVVVLACFGLVLLCATGQEAAELALLLSSAVAVVGALVGMRTHRLPDPVIWWSYVAGALIFGVASSVRVASGDCYQAARPAIELLETLAYIRPLSGSLHLVTARDRDPTTNVDALIVTTGALSGIWLWVLLPFVRDEELAFRHAIAQCHVLDAACVDS